MIGISAAIGAHGALGSALIDIGWVVLGYFVVVNGFYAVLLALAVVDMRRHRLTVRGAPLWRLLASEAAPSLSVLTPAHNEGRTVAASVRALLTLRYPDLEIVVVNDGSTDDTLEVLCREFDLVEIHNIFRRVIPTRPVRALFRSRINPNLVVVDKDNGGKADALNAGLNIATGDLVCAIDADTLIEGEALLRMVRPFVMDADVVAAGGTICVANSSLVCHGRVVDARVPSKWLSGVQVVEYMRAFLFGRLGWNRAGGNLIISGAFGLFRRAAMLDAGGYVHDSVGEDMELVADIRRRGLEHGGPARVVFVPDPVAWTEVPDHIGTLGRQRERWQRGLCDVLWRHRKLLFNPRYGALGMIVYPYFLFVELLAPVIEGVGLVSLAVAIALGEAGLGFAGLFLLLAYGLGLALTAFTLLMEQLSFDRYRRGADKLRLLLWALLEPVGYRQLTVLWRLRGLVRYLGRRTDWGAMSRRGFQAADEALLPGAGSSAA